MKRLSFALFVILAMCMSLFSVGAPAAQSPLHSSLSGLHAQHAQIASPAAAPECKQANGADCRQAASDVSPMSLKTAETGSGAHSAFQAFERQRASQAVPVKTAHGGGSGGVVAWIGAGSGDVLGSPQAGKKSGGKKPPKKLSA